MAHANNQSRWLVLNGFNVIGMALVAMGMFCLSVNTYAEQLGPFASVNVDANLPHYNPQSQVSGSFKVHGSETMHPLLTRLAMEFQRRQPKVAFDVRGG